MRSKRSRCQVRRAGLHLARDVTTGEAFPATARSDQYPRRMRPWGCHSSIRNGALKLGGPTDDDPINGTLRTNRLAWLHTATSPRAHHNDLVPFSNRGRTSGQRARPLNLHSLVHASRLYRTRWSCTPRSLSKTTSAESRARTPGCSRPRRSRGTTRPERTTRYARPTRCHRTSRTYGHHGLHRLQRNHGCNRNHGSNRTRRCDGYKGICRTTRTTRRHGTRRTKRIAWGRGI
jgi:hypothetical protein